MSKPLQGKSQSRNSVYGLQTVNHNPTSSEALQRALEQLTNSNEVKSILEKDPELWLTLLHGKETFAIKIRAFYKSIYKRMIAPSTLKREALRQAVEQAILGIAEMPNIELYKNPEVNVTLSPTIKIENRVEAKAQAEANAQVSIILKIDEVIDRLLEYIELASNSRVNLRGYSEAIPGIHPSVARKLKQELIGIKQLIRSN